jgi:hypothetical protein
MVPKSADNITAIKKSYNPRRIKLVKLTVIIRMFYIHGIACVSSAIFVLVERHSSPVAGTVMGCHIPLHCIMFGVTLFGCIIPLHCMGVVFHLVVLFPYFA